MKKIILPICVLLGVAHGLALSFFFAAYFSLLHIVIMLFDRSSIKI